MRTDFILPRYIQCDHASVLDIPGQSRFVTTCPGKNTVLPDAHLSRFWLGVLYCSDIDKLRYSTVLIGGQN